VSSPGLRYSVTLIFTLTLTFCTLDVKEIPTLLRGYRIQLMVEAQIPPALENNNEN
jgi:hypothetical protein